MTNLPVKRISILESILKDPHLPERVRSMSDTEILAIIRKVGLEDCGEILAFAESAQIELVFDSDLWRSQTHGADESFDGKRFGSWLEVLIEIGAEKAAAKLTEMDEAFIAMAFSSLAFVVREDLLRQNLESHGNDSRLERIMDARASFEIQEFILFARYAESWDSFVSILSELDSRHFSFLERILSKLADQFEYRAQDEGLHNVFSDEEQLYDDVSYEREKRREERGFVPPAQARAFLEICKGGLQMEDHVTPARLLKESGTISSGKFPVEKAPHRFSRVFAIFARHPENRDLYMEQLNFLANVLMSGWSWPEARPRPARAMEIVLEACERGLKTGNEEFSSFSRAFRAGWPA